MTISKSGYVDIKPGQFALVFQQPFGPYDRTLPKHLERFVSRGGGWDTFRASELFEIHIVCSVAPNTYKGHLDDAELMEISFPRRYPRSHVIAVGKTVKEVMAIRDRLFNIGAIADSRIEQESRRLIAKFEADERAHALTHIHELLPHVFGEAQ
nr:hypothetical protein [Brucella anthropi]